MSTLDSPADPLNSGTSGLPLKDFIDSLKENKFPVGPGQIADAYAIIAAFGAQMSSEVVLCDLLAPIFSRTRDEQQLFKKLFNDYFLPPVLTETPGNILISGEHELEIKIRWWVHTSIGLALGLIAVFCYLMLPKMYSVTKPPTRDSVKSRIIFTLSDPEGDNKQEIGQQSFMTSVGKPLSVSVAPEEGETKVKYSIHRNWGDGSAVDTGAWHKYHKPGHYQLRISVSDIHSNAGEKQHDTVLTEEVSVSSVERTLKIVNSSRSTLLQTNQHITLQGVTTGPPPDSLIWTIGDIENAIDKKGGTLDTAFSSAGNQAITVTAYYRDTTFYNLSNRINFVVRDYHKPNTSIDKAPGAQLLFIKQRVSRKYYYIAITILILAAVWLLSGWRLLKQRFEKLPKQPIEKRYRSLLVSLEGVLPPFDLTFKPKDYLITPEVRLYQLAWDMRKRIIGESLQLDVRKTVDQTIENLGLFKPVHVQQSKHVEFVILIDRSHSSPFQAKLTSYLIDKLSQQNVFIQRFYYERTPLLCFNADYPQGIALKKINDRLADHILLLVGQAGQLCYKEYPRMREDILEDLKLWNKKALLTFKPLAEWGQKELLVSMPVIPLLTVDLLSLSLLMQGLFTGEFDFLTEQKKISPPHDIVKINFEKIECLIEYCETQRWARRQDDREKNLLLQWIAVLAIYPKIEWDLMIQLGYALLKENRAGEQLTYSNLLFIARIPWMACRIMPEGIRLELLKCITVENEVIAREAILVALSEISIKEIDEQCFSYEEKRLQEITNAFVLFAYNEKKYAAYLESANLFARLWNSGKIIDATQKVYLSNEEQTWTTPLGNALQSNSPTGQLDAYLQQFMKGDQKADYRPMLAIILPFVLSFVALMLLVFIDYSSSSYFDKFKIRQPVSHMINFKWNADTSLTWDELKLSVNDHQLNVESMLKDIAVPVVLSGKTPVSLTADELTWLDTLMTINYDAYVIRIARAKLVLNYDFIPTPTPGKTCIVRLTAMDSKGVPLHRVRLKISSQIADIKPVQGVTNEKGVFTYLFNYPKVTKATNGYPLHITAETFFGKTAIDFNVPPPALPLAKRGIVNIHYIDNIWIDEMKTVQTCINSDGIFNVKRLIVEKRMRPSDTASNIIYYHDKSIKDSLIMLRNCLSANFTRVKFLPVYQQRLNSTTAPLDIWFYSVFALSHADSLIERKNQVIAKNFPKTHPYSVLFEYDSSVLRTSSYPVLDAISADLRSSGASVVLEGYMSSEGTMAHNLSLSKDKANSVKTYLVNSGVAAKKVKVKAYGETHPLADNRTETGRILNRRVDIVFQKVN